MVAGVGVGVVEEEGAEDGASEDEVVVVWVSEISMDRSGSL